MRTRSILLLTVSFMLISLPGFPQVNQSKGFGNNDLEKAIELEKTGPLYSESKKVCHALAFGVLDFDSPSLLQLNFPDKDCRAFFNAVNNLFRFEYEIRKYDMLEIENARRTFDNAFHILDSLSRQMIHDGDIVLMYFSGHGLTFRDHYHFPLKNSNPDSYSLTITGGNIINVAETLANKGAQVFVFLDTCASGSIIKETVNLNGKGGIACFPACSANTTTRERLTKGGSSFGDRLRKILSGESFAGTDVKTMSTEDISRELTPEMRGDVRPVYFDSSQSNIKLLTLIHNVSGKNLYNKNVELYKEYIENALTAMKAKKYDEAVTDFSLALAFTKEGTKEEDKVKEEDRVDLSEHITSLNNDIAQSMKSSKTDDVWKYLSNLKEENDLIDQTKISFTELYYGCGAYYKSIGNTEIAYSFFMKAYERGDKKNSPYEIYLLTENLDLPPENPIDKLKRLEFLEIAAENGNKLAYETLNPTTEEPPKPLDPQKSFYERVLKDRSWAGVALTTDAKMFPIGIQGNFFGGWIHLGADVSMGSDLFQAPSTSSLADTTPGTIDVTDGKLEMELVSSEYEKPKGVISYTVTPGFFYQGFSLDIGLGQIWTATNRVDTYTYSYQTTTTTLPTGGHSSTSGGGRTVQNVKEKNHYFVIRPGMSLLIRGKRVSGQFGLRGRICPSDKNMNEAEFTLGILFKL